MRGSAVSVPLVRLDLNRVLSAAGLGVFSTP